MASPHARAGASKHNSDSFSALLPRTSKPASPRFERTSPPGNPSEIATCPGRRSVVAAAMSPRCNFPVRDCPTTLRLASLNHDDPAGWRHAVGQMRKTNTDVHRLAKLDDFITWAEAEEKSIFDDTQAEHHRIIQDSMRRQCMKPSAQLLDVRFREQKAATFGNYKEADYWQREAIKMEKRETTRFDAIFADRQLKLESDLALREEIVIKKKQQDIYNALMRFSYCGEFQGK